MPSNLLDLDSRFPSLQPERSVDERFSEVLNYLYMLLEQLRYTLSHLGSENFNQTEVVQWLKDEGVADMDEITQRVLPEIEEVADIIINQQVPSIIDGQVPAIINQQVPSILAQQVPAIVRNTVDGDYIDDEIYAAYGTIADLTVDRLRTDYRKARCYLEGSQEDINYIYIHDEVIEFRTASVVSGAAPVQLTWDDRAFWWTDAQHTAMTSRTQTEWPVLIYQYSEYVKARFAFLQKTGETDYLPTLQLGAGDQSGHNIAFIRKETDALKLLYTDTAGADIGMVCWQDGFMDLLGLRRTDCMDFSGWDSGAFREILEGGRVLDYTVMFDTESRPMRITDEAGHECAIYWDSPAPTPGPSPSPARVYYTVTFRNGSTVLQTVTRVPDGGSAQYTGDTPVKNSYYFLGWLPQPVNVHNNLYCDAQFANSVEITEITDSWETVVENRGIPYYIGQYKFLELGTVDGFNYGTIRMQKVCVTEDAAKSVWVAMEAFADGHRMNQTNTYAGGWRDSEMRKWLNQTVINLLPEALQNGIVMMTKYSYDPYSDPDNQYIPTSDRLWIPGNNEETSSGPYGRIFTGRSARIRTRGYNGSNAGWYLRDVRAGLAGRFYIIDSNGDYNSNTAGSPSGVVLGFGL